MAYYMRLKRLTIEQSARLFYLRNNGTVLNLGAADVENAPANVSF